MGVDEQWMRNILHPQNVASGRASETCDDHCPHACLCTGHRTHGPRHEAATTVWADIGQRALHTIHAERAFVGADARKRGRGRQVPITQLAIRSQFQSHVTSPALVRQNIIAANRLAKTPPCPHIPPKSRQILTHQGTIAEACVNPGREPPFNQQRSGVSRPAMARNTGTRAACRIKSP